VLVHSCQGFILALQEQILFTLSAQLEGLLLLQVTEVMRLGLIGVVDFQDFSYQMLAESHRVMRLRLQVVVVDQGGVKVEVVDILLEEMDYRMDQSLLELEAHRQLEEQQEIVMTLMV
jgi:hypothetical protein